MNLGGGDIHDLNGGEFGNDFGATFLRDISHALRDDNHLRDLMKSLEGIFSTICIDTHVYLLKIYGD